MDRKDFGLLVTLLRDPLASYEALGRSAGISGTAVKARLEALRRSGVIQGFAALPSAASLGRHARTWRWPQPQTRGLDVTTLLTVEAAVLATAHLDGALAVVTYDETPSAPPPNVLVDLLGEPEGSSPSRPDAPHGAGHHVLSPLDWRILRALADDARAPVPQLATATGLTARTVRKRRADLLASGAVTVLPLVENAQASGGLLYQLVVDPATPSDLDRVRTYVRGCARTVYADDPPGLSLFCFAPSIAQALEDERATRAAPGVGRVAMSMPLRRAFARERVGHWIEERLEAWDRARRGEPGARLG